MYVTQSIHRMLQQRPDDPLTIIGHRTRTVAESADRVARLAGALRAAGVGDGDRVAMLALNSDRYHEYFLAVPWAGAVINPINVRWSVPEIVHALTDSGSTVLLVDDAFAGLLPELRAGCPGLETVVFCGDGAAPVDTLDYEELVATTAPVDDARRGGDALFGVFYTGGTTGLPKGVMLSHDNLLISALGAASTGSFIGRGGRFLHAAPMFHAADIAGWAGVMLGGGTHVIIPAFSPPAVLEAVTRHGITDMLLVPTMIQAVVDHPDVADHDLSGVRSLAYGASPISEAVLDRAAKVFPMAGFAQAYGMTELSPIATLLLPDDHREPALLRSAGRAAPHAEVRVVGPDDVELPRGEVGEVVVAGSHVMLGYWGRPDDTAFATRGGWMHTGDLARMDERGYVFVVDRLKDMIVTGGENVYSTEVENVLGRHPAVAACAVVGIPDPTWGERVHAVIVARSGAELVDDELIEHCRGSIAGYKVPRSVEVVDALPVSGAGKVLKRELRDRYWSGEDRRVH